ncbi:C-type lectin domain family 4 member F-like isoform X2 [Mauremys mutica]|uniref:C-type lectin domain family 4 member F-like isoform X2 n=1 Tax=Mauremys mutica TaxID=74926 RepID=UPI001D160A3D|nr:C-type lectin domain family 4 member F-like isoform X2 [Mauremys mutica]
MRHTGPNSDPGVSRTSVELHSGVSICPPVPEPSLCSSNNLGTFHSPIAGGRAPPCGHVSQLSVCLAQGCTYKPVHGSALQLLDEAQAGVRKLKAQLGNLSAAYGEIQIRLDNVSAAYGEIQIRLDNVSAARAAVQGRYSYLLTKVSRGWTFFNGNFYYFSHEKKPWDEAEQFCVSQDSYLTSVSSHAEQEFLSSKTHGEAHWIGLTDQETEDSWRWADGTEYRADASRGFWAENQPDNYDPKKDGGEDCVHTEPRKRNLWNDVKCTQPFRWICKQAHGQAGL